MTPEQVKLLLDAEILSAKDLGLLADHFWRVKQLRLAADKVSKGLKTDESAAEAKLISQMLRQEVSAVGGGDVIFTMGAPKQEPIVTNWQEFWAFIKTSDDMSLFEKRPGRAAIKERWEQGEVIPGVAKFTVYSLSKQGVKK